MTKMDWALIAMYFSGLLCGWMWNDIFGGNRFHKQFHGDS